ncbi:MAG: hypothetical protein QOH88_3019 [Verrucomicrobiota bacterium]
MVAAVTAAAIWWGLYRSHHTSSAAVTTLLPKETIAFVHFPDFNRSWKDFHQTDLYKIWSEPAVQDFLQKPRSKIPKNEAVGRTIQDVQSTEIKDAFIAVISIDYTAWKVVGGFRFKGDDAKAQTVVENWRAKVLGRGPEFKHETVDYQGHQIQAESSGEIHFATVRDGQWFLVANDLDQLKALLDRVDGRAKDAATTLAADDVYTSATKHMPSAYTGLAFVNIEQIIKKFLPAEFKLPDVSEEQLALIRKVRSFSGAVAFDGGKMRDVLFVGMPKASEMGKLARVSLPIATKETLFYTAGFADFNHQVASIPQFATLVPALQKFITAFTANGITLDTWNGAFGQEFGVLADWPAKSHWPLVFAALPVKDSTKANKIVTVLTTADTDNTWTHQEKEGVQYYSTSAGGQFLTLSPTVAVSNKMVVLGMDATAVEAAMKRSAGKSELAGEKTFQEAERAVGSADQAFTYIDPALIYTRVDATVRPMLFMGAAFIPGIADTVDLSKVPAPDVITRHLSPIVMAQRYDGDGYVAESVGPVTANQSLLFLAGLAGGGAAIYHQQTQAASMNTQMSSPPSPSSTPMDIPDDSPSPTPSPSPSPNDSDD